MSQMDLKLLSDVLHALVSSFSKTLQFPLSSMTYSSDDSLITIPKINFRKKKIKNKKPPQRIIQFKIEMEREFSYLLGDR